MIFTARKRSLRRLCFYRCVSVQGGGLHPGGGGFSIQEGGFSIRGGGVLHPGGVLLRGGFSIPGGVGGSPSGQCAGGTHSTGMHSCIQNVSHCTR